MTVSNGKGSERQRRVRGRGEKGGDSRWGSGLLHIVSCSSSPFCYKFDSETPCSGSRVRQRLRRFLDSFTVLLLVGTVISQGSTGSTRPLAGVGLPPPILLAVASTTEGVRANLAY